LSKKESRTHQRLVDKCPECGSGNLVHDYDTGETVCGDCGLVLYEQMMDKGPEWRAFTQEEKASRSRVGVPTSYSVHDKGLSTAISQVDRDAFGRKLPLSTRLQMWRLRKWQIRPEFTLPLTETWLRQWLSLTGFPTRSTFPHR